MLWRWIIRGICIALLTLCVTVWVGSYWRAINFFWDSHGNGWNGEANSGLLACWRFNKSDMHYLHLGIERAHDPEGLKSPLRNVKHRFIGFAFQAYEGNLGWQLYVPLWFPTLLSTLFLWLIWRKTRPKYTGKGFPVEPAAKPNNA